MIQDSADGWAETPVPGPDSAAPSANLFGLADGSLYRLDTHPSWIELGVPRAETRPDHSEDALS